MKINGNNKEGIVQKQSFQNVIKLLVHWHFIHTLMGEV